VLVTDFGEPSLDRHLIDPPGLECLDPVADFADPDFEEWSDPERPGLLQPGGDQAPECSECAETEK
jgi:hypothetical protein